jgi:hypothetical protein
MNSDRVKEILLAVEEPKTEFSVIFSGKKSSLVNGLYKPQTREIILHNRNFEDDLQLVYTALHEYAHHLHCERKGFVYTGRAHTNEYWSIFHELLEKAEARGHYRNVFEDSKEFRELTARIKTACVAENGRVMLEFGRLMIEAERLCRVHKVRFEDYVDRILGLPRITATSAMKAASYQVPAEIGWDAMKLVSGIKDPDRRHAAEEAFQAGKSPETVKALIRTAPPGTDPEERLVKEKERIERTIARLQDRLAQLDEELRRMEAG